MASEYERGAEWAFRHVKSELEWALAQGRGAFYALEHLEEQVDALVAALGRRTGGDEEKEAA